MTILAALPGMRRSLLVLGGLAKPGNRSGIVNLVGHQLRFFGLGWYFLDDYAGWLGQREGKIADIMALSPEIREPGGLRLSVMVSEAKYIESSSLAAKRKESVKQLR